jgi:hypothetical protein
VNCDFTNNKNPTVIKFGTCIVNVLCPPQVKYYTVKVLIVERYLSIKIKHL